MFANNKKRLDCFNDTIRTKKKHAINLSLHQAASTDGIIVEENVESEEELVQDAELTKTVAWIDLNVSTKQRRQDASRQAQGK